MPKRHKSVPALLETDLKKTIDYLRRVQKELRARPQEMLGLHASIRNSSGRYRDLFDSAPISYVTMDANGRIMEANQAAAALLADVTLLRGQMFEHFVHLKDRPLYEERFRRCQRRRLVCSFEVALRCRRGEAVPVQLNILRSERVAGSVREFRVVMMDLTEIKRVQAELEEAKRLLEERVNERTRELTENLQRLAIEADRRMRLEDELWQISERERRRFGQDLHDDVCQSLTSLALEMATLSRRLAKDENPRTEECHRIALAVAELVQNTRQIAQGLHPVGLNGGLAHALEQLTARISGKVHCLLRLPKSSVSLRPEIELALYRIAQEALNNVVKHAQASRVEVQLHVASSGLLLIIQDDGAGLPKPLEPFKPSNGMGLDILGYRARSIGAQLTVENLPKRGVRVSCRVPAAALRDSPPH